MHYIKKLYYNFVKSNSGNMRRKLVFTATTMLLLVSCLPVFDTVPLMRIVNRTCDTILVGRAYCDNIDSITHFVETLERDTTEVRLKLKEDLRIVRRNLIAPDSFAIADARISSGQNGKGYLFILKYNTTKNHTWDKICKDRLYDTLFVTRDMLDERNRIEYHGKKVGHVESRRKQETE